MISYIDAYKEQFGVEAICRVLKQAGRFREYGESGHCTFVKVRCAAQLSLNVPTLFKEFLDGCI